MLTCEHEYCGLSDYWGGNGKRWNANVGCLFAYYGRDTTLRDCVDQWVTDFDDGGDCDEFSPNITQADVRAAILSLLTPKGLIDYQTDALAECAQAYAAINTEENADECNESPVWILLLTEHKTT